MPCPPVRNAGRHFRNEAFAAAARIARCYVRWAMPVRDEYGRRITLRFTAFLFFLSFGATVWVGTIAEGYLI